MRKINPRNWFGFLTVENADEVFDAIDTFLHIDGEPRYYTFVAYNKEMQHCTNVRTSQRLAPHKSSNGRGTYRYYYRFNPQENGSMGQSIDLPDARGADMAGWGANDDYGVWGVSTTAHDGDDSETLWKRGAYIVFSDGQLKIEQLNGYGETLLWIIAPE